MGDVDGDGNLNILATNSGSANASVLLNQPPAPILTSLVPNSGPVDTSVTITGSYLGGATSVSFNGTAQTSFTSNSATQLVLTVPAGATSSLVTVTMPSGNSNGLPFTVVNCSVTPADSRPVAGCFGPGRRAYFLAVR
nr:IPT/TIG domain-containing protein [Hymenobacter negativus]